MRVISATKYLAWSIGPRCRSPGEQVGVDERQQTPQILGPGNVEAGHIRRRKLRGVRRRDELDVAGVRGDVRALDVRRRTRLNTNSTLEGS
jgi:hypothetical protein